MAKRKRITIAQWYTEYDTLPKRTRKLIASTKEPTLEWLCKFPIQAYELKEIV